MGRKSIAIVVGGSGDLGSAIVRELLEAEYHVIFTYNKNREQAARLFDELASNELEYFSLDIREGKKINAFFEGVIKKHGFIDVLINSAGISHDGPMLALKDEQWWDVVETNIRGIYRCCCCVAKHMIFQKNGVIVNLSSIASDYGGRGQTNYVVSKRGIEGLTRSLAMELGKKGIRINAVAPGIIVSKMSQGLIEHETIKQHIALKRFGAPREVAKVILFLCSKSASYIAGQVIKVDGGVGVL